MNLLFATTNKNKVIEVQSKLPDGFIIDNLNSIGFKGELPETHETLYENAIEKAMYIYEHYGRNCFADDSGLMIDALNGEPGVYSARYAGEPKNDLLNTEKVLKNMATHNNRAAKFKTVIALVISYEVYLFEGEVNGTILNEPIGYNGFGYDPIFKPEGYDQSFAELSLAEKNLNSHRSHAVEKLAAFLKQHQLVNENFSM
jgi:XTP/dITP diphosphohydrolase